LGLFRSVWFNVVRAWVDRGATATLVEPRTAPQLVLSVYVDVPGGGFAFTVPDLPTSGTPFKEGAVPQPADADQVNCVA
jgi:hypothetical protein